MIPLIWLRGIIIASVISAVLGVCYLGYSKIKHIGYLEAETKYTEIIKEYNNTVAKKIDALEQSSSTLVSISTANNSKLTKEVNGIIYGLKGKTLTIVKDGECVPSKEFSDSFNTINRTVNQNIKDSQK